MQKEQKINSSIYSTTKKICKEVGINLKVEFEPEALDLIAELTWKKLFLFGADLEAFQKHAKRSTINSDDVKLLIRRNDSLKEIIEAKLQLIQGVKGQEGNEGNPIGVKRKRKATNSSN